MNLIDVIDGYLQEQERRPRMAHYPSDVLACRRKLYWKWMDEEESNPVTPGGLWKMHMGNYLHRMFTDALVAKDLDLIDEVEGKTYVTGLLYPFSFRVDGLFIDDDGVYAGADYKTSYGRGVKELQKTGMPKHETLAELCRPRWVRERPRNDC